MLKMPNAKSGFALQGVLLVVCVLPVWAQEPPACARLLSARDVLDCALTNHPELGRAKAEEAQAGALEAVALQRPNPDLETRGLIGRFQGEALNKIEGALLHTFELGGKRRSRVERARAEREIAAAALLKAKEDIALEIVSALYRLRQIRDETAVLEKTLASVAAVRDQLRSRPRLTPEQEVSLEVLQLADSEGGLRKAALEGEETTLIRSLELAISTPLPTAPSTLPAPKEDWPRLPDAVPPDALLGSGSLLARAGLESARADVALARSAAFPDMKTGPAMERDGEGSAIRQSYGVSLGLQLPLYHRNGAGRELARLGVKKAERSLDAAQRSLSAERAAELARYRAAIKSLGTTPAKEQVEDKMRRIQGISSRGLIPSSLLIETYRQVFELTRSRHEAELTAVRSLWRIYAIEGRVMTEEP